MADKEQKENKSSNLQGWWKKQTDGAKAAYIAAFIGGIFTVFATLLGGGGLLNTWISNRPPPTPTPTKAISTPTISPTSIAETEPVETEPAEMEPATPACISADDILVKFQISKNGEMIATLSPGETLFLGPGWIVDFEVLITSIEDESLPEFEYIWKNTGVAAGGELLQNTGHMVDYRSGQDVVDDAISMQLSQPDCSALAPYPFFISPILEVEYEVVPCFEGERKILVNLNPTGGNGEYLYTRLQVFEVQIDDTVTLVVTSGDGQIWDESIHITKELMTQCLPIEGSGGGGGEGGGGRGDP